MDKLAENPQDSVLLVKVSGYEDASQPGTDAAWYNAAYLDPSYQAVIEQIVPQLPNWSFGDEQERFQLFASLLDHSSQEVRTLALKELDRADYSVLRELNLEHLPSGEDIATGDPELLPIRILLAGLAGRIELTEVLESGLHNNVDTDLPYLGAYSSALVELNGSVAAEEIANDYLRSDTIPFSTREKILESFAILARAGAPETSQAIRQITTDVLLEAPELAPAVARQFGFQSDWSQSEAMAEAARGHKFADIADLFAVNQYVTLAQTMSLPEQ
ncbi:hypothetical protein [Pseudoruegeria sp. HB172150]|uniref:hypothetical protein n=1 Tax=Pseudoruegeria sp. HB172150 TaxID=2721164 RepID=UPI001551D922|nr:hypothetical protein [Pseudoruegeria sp. HB172150]